MKQAPDYVNIIMRDETEKIVAETPTIFENARIERIYEFEDGAVVKYEWRDSSLGQFNHRFTLVTPPDQNPANVEAGVLRTINY